MASGTTPAPSAFSDRYSRQILFPGIGPDRQCLLAAAHVAIVGVGATGAAAAALLGRAGIGRLTLIDRDFVEPSNLQRQILFDEQDARDALPKAEAARRKITAFNSSIHVEAVVVDLVPGNIHALLAPAHLLLDCTDNFETRYLLNDFAVQQAKPWIYAAAVAAYCATMTVLPVPGTSAASAPPPEQTYDPARATYEPTACLACLFPTPPAGPFETCDTAGILSTAVNLVASIQVTEALKLLTLQPTLIRRSLLSFDLWSNQRAEISTALPDPACRVCGTSQVRQFTHLDGAARPHITLCGRDSVQIHEHRRPIDLAVLAATLALQDDLQDLRFNPMLLRFRRGPHTFTVFRDGRALIQGTTDPAVARSLYARFLGS